jgi:hypothetical protein
MRSGFSELFGTSSVKRQTAVTAPGLPGASLGGLEVELATFSQERDAVIEEAATLRKRLKRREAQPKAVCAAGEERPLQFPQLQNEAEELHSQNGALQTANATLRATVDKQGELIRRNQAGQKGSLEGLFV